MMLTRPERVAAVHAALERGRYVEIRGDAGVGKSGLLKHFAEQISTEAQVIVLSPSRTTPKGWTAMRSVLGFDGTAHDLLSDLAGDGGAMLFVDNLDFFEEEERRTVVDLVREAASVPGFAVITTARRKFGVEEPSWLPSDALARLGRAEPIVIGELSETEVEEMRQIAPNLDALLADNHPAREVIRNLFRLARLAIRLGNQPVPRTEVDMAEQWWRTADGRMDGNHRERARLLRALSEQALSHAGPLDVRERPPEAVNTLVASETLRDLGNDRVALRHDVLREWAIANLLHSEPGMIERLPLDRPAPAALARGVELAARMAIERSADSTRWQSLVGRLSREGTHGSWRRSVLLALVRSEIGPELLTRASGLLFANRAILLRELLRIVMAVEVEPAANLFAALGIDTSKIPASLNVPSRPSWHRLILWLLWLDQTLPAAAIPDVVDLYTAWSGGRLGLDPITPLLVPHLYRWLTEIEEDRSGGAFRDRREAFGGEVDRDRMRTLASDLRTTFLAFCHRMPALAKEYLLSVSQRRHNDDVVRAILKFRGSLAQAAPAELAELTVTALIAKPEDDESHHRDGLEGPFDFVDHEFLPASPAQGPFFELLTHAPQHGLPLIHRLVDHAISFHTGGREHGTDAITISFPDGERAFSWKRSYMWSRENGSHHYCIASSLMALEAWAHRRIEAGEPFDKVLADVLGPPGSPAAYLLIAVDLLLSHWPKSREAAVPFVACPELLCIDRERQIHDNFEYPDVFGFKALQKEPVGAVSLEGLKQRTSRKVRLEELLDHYAVFGPAELRDTLVASLRRVAERLGPFDEKSNLGNPTFMAVHAINRANPSNHPEVLIRLSDGTQTTATRYVSPPAESRRLEALQEAARGKNADAEMQAAVGLALEDTSRSSPKFAASAIEWARSSRATPESKGTDTERMREQAVLAAAMIAVRDGDAEVRALNADWVRSVFAQALRAEEDPVHQVRSGIRFNPIAIAFVGMIHLLKDRADIGDVRAILEVAASDNAASAHGFGVMAETLASIDERFPRAVLRCAFAACIQPSRDWDLPEEEIAARLERRRQRVQAVVDAEVAWLSAVGPEPGWPEFPLPQTSRRRRVFRLPGGRAQPDAAAPESPPSNQHVNHRAAALWLGKAANLFDVSKHPWVRDVARTYGPWTAAANGSGLAAHEEIADPHYEWNDAYFNLLARCMLGLSLPEIEQLALAPISSLPDEAFCDAIAQFLRSIDAVFFNDGGLPEELAVGIRSALATRLTASSGWEREAESRSASIERHIGPAIAVLFFNDHGFAQPTKCYLYPKGIDRLDPFLPVLGKLVQNGPSLFVATVTLNLLEVSPRPAHLAFMVLAAKAWLNSRPDDNPFWVDHGIGRRVCLWIEEVRRQDQALLNLDKAVRHDVDRLLAALISLGVADARRLEEALARGSESAD